MSTPTPHGRRLDLENTEGFRAAQRVAMRDRARVNVTRWNQSSSTGLNVAVISPPRLLSAHDLVYPMSYNYRIDPLILRRLEVISITAGIRIVAVETPGVTINYQHPALTPPASVERAAFFGALRGSFSGLARTQLTALREVAGVDVSTSRFLGESLGAQSVVSMTQGLTPLSVDLVEPVNMFRLGLSALMRLSRTLQLVEEPLRARYVQRSADEGWLIPPIFEDFSTSNAITDKNLKRFRVQGQFAALSAFAMRRGLIEDAEKLSPGLPLRIWRGNESTACTNEAAERFASHLSSHGILTELISLRLNGTNAGHHVLTDLNAATGFALELRRLWGRS